MIYVDFNQIIALWLIFNSIQVETFLFFRKPYKSPQKEVLRPMYPGDKWMALTSFRSPF